MEYSSDSVATTIEITTTIEIIISMVVENKFQTWNIYAMQSM